MRRRRTRPTPPLRFTFEAPGGTPPRRPRKRRIRWLRLATVSALLGVLGLASAFFGFMTAIAQEVPQLDQLGRRTPDRIGAIYARHGDKEVRLAELRSSESRVIVQPNQISTAMKRAIVAIEDERFYEHDGVDPRAIVRAAFRRVRTDAVEGGSTITQQFVKNTYLASPTGTLDAEQSLRRKLREALLASQLERIWGKEKILAQYLNTIYFGHGTYGVETAARFYFGKPAAELEVDEAALLAALPKSPTQYDPITQPRAARARRNIVIDKMVETGYLTADQGAATKRLRLLPANRRPSLTRARTREPHFVDYVIEQLVNRYGSELTFGGGLKVHTSLDLREQEQARRAVRRTLKARGPVGSLVSIDPRSGQVRAMISGDDDFRRSQFNIATHGRRQPGSAFKPFVLLAALGEGIRPETTFVSRPQLFPLPDGGTWSVTNDQGAAYGELDLEKATALSDNTVYAQLTLTVGPAEVAETAHRLGITSPLDSVHSIGLGVTNVTPLELAHAYATIAARGRRVGGSLLFRPRDSAIRDPSMDPISILRVDFPGTRKDDVNAPRTVQAVPEGHALAAVDAMRGVTRYGTGRRASLGRRVTVGKTGTTSDYRDAWFVGFTPQRAAAVWVGYADEPKPMETEWDGEPVLGGTLPALAWRDYTRQALRGQPLLDWPRAPAVSSAPIRVDPRNGKRAADGCAYARVLVLAVDRVPDDVSDCPDDLTAVPNLAGLTAREAARAVEGSGLTIRLDTQPARPGDTPGQVAEQAPAPLESAPAASVVTVKIAADVPYVVVPDTGAGTRAVDLDEAATLLTAARFRVAVIDGQEGDGPPGTVARQRPAARTQAPLGSVVTLYVVGPAPDVVRLPRVVGLSLAVARRRLVAAGLAVTARRVGGPAYARDRVVSVLPEPGSRVPRGGVVTLTTAPAG